MHHPEVETLWPVGIVLSEKIHGYKIIK